VATFEIPIDDEAVEAISRGLLGGTATQNGMDSAAARDAVSTFVQLAFDEYRDWILGRTRYRSLSELQIERVAAIFNRIMPTEIPSTTRLYNDFGLSHGQATYVARVLADRQLSAWRQIARDELVAQIKGKVAKAKQNQEDGRGEAELQLTLSTLAIRELELVFEAAFTHDTLIAPWKRSNSVGNVHFIATESTTLIALARELDLPFD
jgi:hypothetical protein